MLDGALQLRPYFLRTSARRHLLRVTPKRSSPANPAVHSQLSSLISTCCFQVFLRGIFRKVTSMVNPRQFCVFDTVPPSQHETAKLNFRRHRTGESRSRTTAPSSSRLFTHIPSCRFSTSACRSPNDRFLHLDVSRPCT